MPKFPFDELNVMSVLRAEPSRSMKSRETTSVGRMNLRGTLSPGPRKPAALNYEPNATKVLKRGAHPPS